jgi:hypothetical protein
MFYQPPEKLTLKIKIPPLALHKLSKTSDFSQDSDDDM